MSVPHFTTKYCEFFLIFWWRKSGHYQILEWCFGRTLSVTGLKKNKPSRQGKKKNPTQTDHTSISRENKLKLIKCYLCQNFKPFISLLFFYSQHAVHCTQLPLPLWFTICPVVLGDIYNEVIFTGHPLLLFTPPGPKRTSVSK